VLKLMQLYGSCCALLVLQRRMRACLLQPVALDAAAGVQAVGHAVDLVLAAGSVSVAPAAKALLTSLAKVFAVADVPLSLNTALLVSRAGSAAP